MYALQGQSSGIENETIRSLFAHYCSSVRDGTTETACVVGWLAQRDVPTNKYFAYDRVEKKKKAQTALQNGKTHTKVQAIWKFLGESCAALGHRVRTDARANSVVGENR